MRCLKYLAVCLLSFCFLEGSPAFSTDQVTKIRGKSVKLFADPKGRSKIDTVKTSDIVLPATILSERSNAPYLQVRITFADTGRDPIDAWLKRFKVKTDIPADLVIHCSANDDPNKVRITGVRAVGNKQCK